MDDLTTELYFTQSISLKSEIKVTVLLSSGENFLLKARMGIFMKCLQMNLFYYGGTNTVIKALPSLSYNFPKFLTPDTTAQEIRFLTYGT